MGPAVGGARKTNSPPSVEAVRKGAPVKVSENSNVSSTSDYGGQRCYEN